MQKRALIVDDELATRELIQKVLYAAGMEVLTVTRTADAVNFLQEGKFDVVFLDFHATSPNGTDLVRKMRESGRYNRRVPIVLISSDRDPAALAKGFEAGASFFLYKPIDKRALLRLIRAAHGAMEHERRRTRRVPVRFRVQLQLDKEELEGQTVDMSMTGLRVSVPNTLPVGSSVRVSLYLPSETQPITGVGSVVRIASGNQMGIHLERWGVSESQRLQEFLLPLITRE